MSNDIAMAFDLMLQGAAAQNRKELEEAFQKQMQQIFGLSDEDMDPRNWDHEKKYKMIIMFCSKDHHLREIRRRVPAVFVLIEAFLKAKRNLERHGMTEYAHKAGENIDILLNEIFQLAYPNYPRDPVLDVEKARSSFEPQNAGW